MKSFRQALKNKPKEEKKYVIIAIFVFILCFLKKWYFDIIYQSLFSSVLILNFLIFMLYNVLLILTVINLVKTKSKTNIIALAIYLIIPIFSIFFPFRYYKVDLEMELYKRKRAEIIASVKNNEYILDENGNVKLPKDLKKVSTSGEITVYENDAEGVLICFWVMRGVAAGSVGVMYSSTDATLIYKNETGHPITSIEKLKDNWYLVETNY